MHITVIRRFKGPEYTIGAISVDGNYVCDCIEDTVRELGPNGEGKVHGKTAIPAGTYNVVRTMSPRFKRVLPLLEGVPFFSGVRIHTGNTAEDTEGCLLPGENKVKGKVINSRVCFAKLDGMIAEALDSGDKVTLEIG